MLKLKPDEADQIADAVILLARQGQRLPGRPVRHCAGCAHRVRHLKQWYCMQYGLQIELARRYAITDGARCDVQFSGWAPKPRRWWEFWK